jgi:hypothetical protein
MVSISMLYSEEEGVLEVRTSGEWSPSCKRATQGICTTSEKKNEREAERSSRDK